MSFRRRLALLTAAAVALTAVVGAAASYVLVRQQLHDEVADQMRARAAIHAARGYANIRDLRPLGGPRVPEPPTLPRLISARGEVVQARYPQLEYPLTKTAREVASGRRQSSLEDLRFRDDELKVLTVGAGRGRALQLAQSLGSTNDTLDRMLFALALVAGAGVLAAPLAGLLVARGGLRPVRRLTRAAEGVAERSDLDYRIESHGNDELASLAASFNAMLARLAGMVDTVERARHVQRQLVADASHELRTPLTSLRANVELLALNGDTSNRRDLLPDILQQLDGLTLRVSQLIDLAREDAREPEPEALALDDLVRDEIARARQNHPRVDIDADLEPTPLVGTHASISRAVSNLLDNAAKWTPGGGRVTVTLRDGVLRVRDDGPGIDDADLPHVFERFYRGSGARTRIGSGLGLAIVAQVVAAHGGEVRAERHEGGGTLLTATFSTAETPPARAQAAGL